MKSTQTEKIMKTLTKYGTQSPGISVASLASKTRLDRTAVAKRVYDLRNEGLKIYSNYKTVNGKRVTYYRFVA